MDEYDTLLRLRTTISQVLNPGGCESSMLCTSCTYWINESCSMQFPDAGGSFARDCSCFAPAEHETMPQLRQGNTQSRHLRGVLQENPSRPSRNQGRGSYAQV